MITWEIGCASDANLVLVDGYVTARLMNSLFIFQLLFLSTLT